MPVEIERRFIVRPDLAPAFDEAGSQITQAYLAADPVCVRVRHAAEGSFLTIKSTAPGLRRMEFEYPIPAEDARELLARPEIIGQLSKRRHRLEVEGFVFEVDFFEGPLAGLVIAEVEMDSEDTAIPLPAWLGAEISLRKDFSNEALSRFGLPADFADLVG